MALCLLNGWPMLQSAERRPGGQAFGQLAMPVPEWKIFG